MLQRVTGQLELVALIRAGDVFEDWRAQSPQHGAVIARRFTPELEEEELMALATRCDEVAGPRGLLVGLGVGRAPSGETFLLFEELGSAPFDPRSRGALSLPAALFLIRELAYGLAHAHARGVSHGAVRTDAVWVGPKGEVQLDFGFARRGARPQDDLQAVTTMMAELGGAAMPSALWDTLDRPELVSESMERLVEALDRVFYRDLDLDDEAAARALGSWAHAAPTSPPEPSADAHAERPPLRSFLNFLVGFVVTLVALRLLGALG